MTLDIAWGPIQPGSRSLNVQDVLALKRGDILEVVIQVSNDDRVQLGERYRLQEVVKGATIALLKLEGIPGNFWPVVFGHTGLSTATTTTPLTATIAEILGVTL